MAFIESPRFPLVPALGASGGPEFSTEVIELESGHEQRNVIWSQGRGRWNIGFQGLSAANRDTLIAYFRSVGQGRANGFRFKDHQDYTVALTEGVLLLTSVQDVWQLQKRYTQGANTYDRNIRKPVSGTPVIKAQVTTLTAGVNYTIDTTTGTITMLGSPTYTPDAWSGEFDVPVRFGADSITLEAGDVGSDGLITRVGSVELVEIRV